MRVGLDEGPPLLWRLGNCWGSEWEELQRWWSAAEAPDPAPQGAEAECRFQEAVKVSRGKGGWLEGTMVGRAVTVRLRVGKLASWS